VKNFIAVFIALASIMPVPAASARNLVVSDDITDPTTMDPQRQFSEKTHTICQQIFDGLIRFDPDGKVEPALAVSWERIDDARMRFKLREGVSFHNGEPFDSAAVKFSIERYLDPATNFPARVFIDSIARVETPDKYTADIITKYPDGILLNRLAGFVLISPPLYIKEKGVEYFASNPVGTGAFVFKSWEKGKQISLVANKEYWLAGYPKIEGLVFKFIPQEKQLAALLSGEVDLVTNLSGTQTLSVKSNPRLTVIKKASFYTVTPCFNLSSGPLSNLEVRKALNHAVDKQSLIRYDLLGNGLPIATFSMAGEIGHNSSLVPYEFDLAKAKKLLVKAGYPDGFGLKVLVKNSAERTAKIIASNLRKVGVMLDIILASDATGSKEVKSQKYDMSIGDVPDPMCHSYFIPAVALYSKSPFALAGDPGFDDMLSNMVMTTDPELLKKKAEQVDEYIYNYALGIFTYQRIALYGAKKGLSFTPYLSRMPYFYRAHFYD